MTVTVKARKFKTPLKTMDRSSRQKINKETLTLNDKIDQLDVLDIKGTLYTKTAE